MSEFTTYHPCCESRNININLIADMVDGAVVKPGEVFSLNDHVGERTEEKGHGERHGVGIDGDQFRTQESDRRSLS